MGRPSKLTPAQWAEVERRLLAGESASALGREFDISEAAIRKRFGSGETVSAKSAKVREVAQKIADANTALETLPPGQRPVAMELADILQNTSLSVGRAAELGAKNAHRLQALANAELQKVDDVTPLSDEKSVAALKTVAVLTKMANDSAATPLNLLAANKDRTRPPEEGDKPAGVLVVPGLMADSQAWATAAKGGEAE